MLQEFTRPEGALGTGVSVCFMWDDAIAIHRELCSKGLQPRRPFVGNPMPEETEYSG